MERDHGLPARQAAVVALMRELVALFRTAILWGCVVGSWVLLWPVSLSTAVLCDLVAALCLALGWLFAIEYRSNAGRFFPTGKKGPGAT